MEKHFIILKTLIIVVTNMSANIATAYRNVPAIPINFFCKHNNTKKHTLNLLEVTFLKLTIFWLHIKLYFYLFKLSIICINYIWFIVVNCICNIIFIGKQIICSIDFFYSFFIVKMRFMNANTFTQQANFLILHYFYKIGTQLIGKFVPLSF